VAPLFLVSALLHAYVGWRLLPALPADPAWAWALGVLLAASAWLTPTALLARRRHRHLGPALVWAGLLCMGLFSSLFVLTLARDAVWLLAGLADALISVLPGTQGAAPWQGAPLQHASALAVLLAATLVTALGFWNARRTAAVVRVDVPIAQLPAALHGFTVAQITDVHVGPTIKRGYLQAIVTRVNTLGADMVAITGDLVDGRVSELSAHVAPLAQLQSRHGSYFVTGNHEYYSGAHAWMAELSRLGVRVLMNEHVVLSHTGTAGSAALVVAGVADYSAHHFDPAHRSDPHAAMRGAPAYARVRLLLAHQPRSAVAAAKRALTCSCRATPMAASSGPGTISCACSSPSPPGLHRLQDLWVYTSRGTGYWGPPKRFGAPSEITLAAAGTGTLSRGDKAVAVIMIAR
jgi:predicted MPP superfamily phosphohydrolase